MKVNYQNLKRTVTRQIDAGTIDADRLGCSKAIYDTWMKHTQPSTDNSNNHWRLKIPKIEYLH